MHRSQLTATLPLFLSFTLFAAQTLAADFTGRVVGVSDGDTITVMHNGKASASGCTVLTALRSTKPSGNALNSSPLI